MKEKLDKLPIGPKGSDSPVGEIKVEGNTMSLIFNDSNTIEEFSTFLMQGHRIELQLNDYSKLEVGYTHPNFITKLEKEKTHENGS